MSFIPIKPVVEKVIDKSVEIVPVIGPGIKYVKTAQKPRNIRKQNESIAAYKLLCVNASLNGIYEEDLMACGPACICWVGK